MQKLLSLFLLISGCASEPVATKFTADWTFETPVGTPLDPHPTPKACISEPYVIELRKILLSCEAKK